MVRFRVQTVICVSLAAALGGCLGSARHEIDFDRQGWGGPKLEYSAEADGLITVKSGMLISEDFRWAESEFSFDFLDRRDLAWGVRLMDSVFAAQRREALRNTRLKIGDREFVVGKDLPADQLWKFDTVLDAEFRRDKKGSGYKILDAVWYQRILDSGRTAVRVAAPSKAAIKPSTWNTFHARVSGGKFVFTVNGVGGGGAIEVDRRANGRLGIFVTSDGPLLIRNVRLVPANKPK